jgi:hypothetical protein
VRNEAKLGWTGAYRQRRLSCDVARPGSHPRQTNPISARRSRSPQGKCAEQTQFRPPGEGVGQGSPTHEECGTNPIGECQVARLKGQVSGQRSPACCPLTSPFKPQTSHFSTVNVQNEAKLRRTGVYGKGRCRVGRGPAAGGLYQTNPIWGPERRGHAPHAKCAKRTQFGRRSRVSGGPDAKRHCMPERPTKRGNAQNKPNL